MSAEMPGDMSGGMAAAAQSGESNLDLIMQIPLSVDVVLGSATMPVSRLMKLGRGSIPCGSWGPFTRAVTSTSGPPTTVVRLARSGVVTTVRRGRAAASPGARAAMAWLPSPPTNQQLPGMSGPSSRWCTVAM